MATSPTANAKGEVFFCDAPADKIYKIGLERERRRVPGKLRHAAGLACGPDGLLYAAAGDQIVAYDADAKATMVAEDIRGCCLAAGPNGNIYVIGRGSKETEGNKLWLVRRGAKKRLLDACLQRAAGRSASHPTGGSFALPMAA